MNGERLRQCLLNLRQILTINHRRGRRQNSRQDFPLLNQQRGTHRNKNPQQLSNKNDAALKQVQAFIYVLVREAGGNVSKTCHEIRIHHRIKICNARRPTNPPPPQPSPASTNTQILYHDTDVGRQYCSICKSADYLHQVFYLFIYMLSIRPNPL